MRKLLPFCLALLLASACTPDKELPVGVLDEESYANLLTDLYLAEGCFAVEGNYQYHALEPALTGTYDTLLTEHRVTVGQLDTTAAYYMQHRRALQRIYERLNDNLNAIP